MAVETVAAAVAVAEAAAVVVVMVGLAVMVMAAVIVLVKIYGRSRSRSRSRSHHEKRDEIPPHELVDDGRDRCELRRVVHRVVYAHPANLDETVGCNVALLLLVRLEGEQLDVLLSDRGRALQRTQPLDVLLDRIADVLADLILGGL